MRHPRVSVIIPCYNHGAFLPDALRSLETQTFQDFDITVVDDGSDEPSSVRALETLVHPRTRVIHIPHGGIAAARNAGIHSSQGDLLCCLDSDDLLAPTYLERTVAKLDAEPNLAFVSTWVQMFGRETRLWNPTRCDLSTLLAECTLNAAALVRREAFEAVSGFDPSFGSFNEDWDFWLRLVEQGHAGTILQEPLYQYRRHEGTASDKLRGQVHLDELEKLYAKHLPALQEHILEAFIHKDGQYWEHVARSDALLDEVGSLRAETEQLEVEVQRLESKLRLFNEEHHRNEQPLREAHQRVNELLASRSWRLTGPLRSAWELLTGLKGNTP